MIADRSFAGLCLCYRKRYANTIYIVFLGQNYIILKYLSLICTLGKFSILYRKNNYFCVMVDYGIIVFKSI